MTVASTAASSPSVRLGHIVCMCKEPVLSLRHLGLCLQILADLPAVGRMAAAKDLQRFLNKYHQHAYRLVHPHCMFLMLSSCSSAACV